MEKIRAELEKAEWALWEARTSLEKLAKLEEYGEEPHMETTHWSEQIRSIESLTEDLIVNMSKSSLKHGDAKG